MTESRKKAEQGSNLSFDKKSIWSAIEERIAVRVKEGALTDPAIGTERLHKEIKNEFSVALKRTGYKLTKKSFERRTKKAMWVEGPKSALATLQEVVKHDLPLERFYKYHPYIPADAAEKKARELRGTTNAEKSSPVKFLKGINRISGFGGLKTIKDFAPPTTSFNAPFTIGVPNSDNFRFMVLNGANIGIKHGRLIKDNPVRQALSSANRFGCNSVFVTNMLDVDMTKAAGPLKALRALFSGRNINIGLLDPAYQEKAQEILNTLPDDQLVYETANEAFENLATGWEKASRLPERRPYNGMPEFHGKIYIVLGYKEEDFVATATYWEAAYHTNVARNKLEAELKEAKKFGYEEEIERLTAEIARTRVTPVSPQEWQRFFPKVLAHVISRFEEAIPNSKVVGINTTHIKIGSKAVELHIPDHIRITDMLLSSRVKAHGPQVLRESLADIIVTCHPYSLNNRVTARERDAQGKRKGQSLFCVAPVCVDAEFLRSELKTIVRKGAHPIGKAIFNEQFEPGVLLVDCVNGVLNQTPVSIGALKRFSTFKKKTLEQARHRGHVPLMHAINPLYIWLMEATDPHFGSRNRETIWCEEQESRLGMTEAAFHLMRREGLFEKGSLPPVHMFVANDDITQGNHFETHQQPHPHQLSYAQLENAWRKVVKEAHAAQTKSDVIKIFLGARDLMLYQIQIRGIDWLHDQIGEVFERLIAPNIDAFSGILLRAQESQLIIRGLSEFEGVPKDSRDLGVINEGSGNHFTKTVDKRLVEGPIFADKIRMLLRSLPEWSNKEDELNRLVKAPLYSNRFMAWGTAQIPGGYEWAFDLRDSPPGGVDWNDPLRQTVINDMKRGNYARIFEGKKTVKTYGDKHFLSMIMTPWAIFLMGPPGTHTDLFGEFGFPPNNTGVCFLGLPVDGPDGGPILLRALLYSDLKRIVEEKRPFDWKKFLPNPV